MKVIIFLSLTLTSILFSQGGPDSLNFFLHHAGDVQQYRSQFTGEITMTEYLDKDSTDQFGNIFIWYHNAGWGTFNIYKIDSSGNVYILYSVSDTGYVPLLYKLSADTGTVWPYLKRDRDSILAKVVEIFPPLVYGKQVTVK